MQQRILELIPRILNEQLTEELLLVNDNLNNIFLRHERYFRDHLSLSLVLSFSFICKSALLFSIVTISLILIGLNGSDLVSLQRYFSIYLACLSDSPPFLQKLSGAYMALPSTICTLKATQTGSLGLKSVWPKIIYKFPWLKLDLILGS